eukprot:g12423.t1
MMRKLSGVRDTRVGALSITVLVVIVARGWVEATLACLQQESLEWATSLQCHEESWIIMAQLQSQQQVQGQGSGTAGSGATNAGAATSA